MSNGWNDMPDSNLIAQALRMWANYIEKLGRYSESDARIKALDRSQHKLVARLLDLADEQTKAFSLPRRKCRE